MRGNIFQRSEKKEVKDPIVIFGILVKDSIYFLKVINPTFIQLVPIISRII